MAQTEKTFFPLSEEEKKELRKLFKKYATPRDAEKL